MTFCPQPAVTTEKLQHIHKQLVVFTFLEYRPVSCVVECIDEQHNHREAQENITQKQQRRGISEQQNASVQTRVKKKQKIGFHNVPSLDTFVAKHFLLYLFLQFLEEIIGSRFLVCRFHQCLHAQLKLVFRCHKGSDNRLKPPS